MSHVNKWRQCILDRRNSKRKHPKARGMPGGPIKAQKPVWLAQSECRGDCWEEDSESNTGSESVHACVVWVVAGSTAD